MTTHFHKVPGDLYTVESLRSTDLQDRTRWELLLFDLASYIHMHTCPGPRSPHWSHTRKAHTSLLDVPKHGMHALGLWLSHWMLPLPEMISSRYHYHQRFLTPFKPLLKHSFSATYPGYSKIVNCPSWNFQFLLCGSAFFCLSPYHRLTYSMIYSLCLFL